MLRVREQSINTQHCVSVASLVRTVNLLTRHDYASALQLLACVEAQAGDIEGFARAAVRALRDYVAADLATLSICDLVTGHRQVVGVPGKCLDADEVARFDRHSFDLPLVRPHGLEGGGLTRRISDRVGRHDGSSGALDGDPHGRTGLEYAIVVPLFRSPQMLVNVVLNRRGRDFGERDCERLELVRAHLAFFYRQACRLAPALPSTAPLAPLPGAMPPEPGSFGGLTPRESQVMHWLSCGKTDAEIAALLLISPRTVQKHLEHVYVKLGVETRTAAVMRVHAGQRFAPGQESSP